MIFASNRVPGQLMPVGARYWENVGRPINALQSIAGLSGIAGDLGAPGDSLTSEQASQMILSEGQSPVINNPGAAAAAAAAGVGAGVIIAAILVRGGLGYVAGRAMAPSAAKKNSYGWWGVLAGGVFGVTGLAVQGVVALSKK